MLILILIKFNLIKYKLIIFLFFSSNGYLWVG